MSGNKDKAFDILYYLWDLNKNEKIIWNRCTTQEHGLFVTEIINGFNKEK